MIPSTLLLVLALQAPPQAVPARGELVFARAAIAGYVVAGFTDLSTTMYGIGQGTLVERNPVLAPLSDDPLLIGLAKGGLTVGTAYLFLKMHKSHPKLTAIVATAAGAVTMWAALHNRRELTR